MKKKVCIFFKKIKRNKRFLIKYTTQSFHEILHDGTVPETSKTHSPVC